MHTTGRMWTLNNSSQDFSVIKEMEVLKRGFPLQAILVKSNSAIRQNVTTLLLLKEKTFPLFLSLPCTCSSGSKSAGTLIVTCFMVCSLPSATETLCESTLEVLGQEINTAAEHGRREHSKSRHQIPPSQQLLGFQECGWSWILPLQ